MVRYCYLFSYLILQKPIAQNGNLENGQNDDESSHDPTPKYNFDILSDLTTKQNNDFLREKFNNSKGVLEAVKLLNLWLLKRELNTVKCFTSYLFFL